MLVRLAFSMLALAVPAGAAHSGAQLAISATVLKAARFTVQGQPAALQVSEADVLRGYVELPAGARLEVWSNSREGLLVTVSAAEPFLLESATLLPRGSQKLELRYRLGLAPATAPGTYPWPLRITASPL